MRTAAAARREAWSRLARGASESLLRRVAAVTVPNVRRASLMPHLSRRVLPATMIYTDELKSYDGLARDGYRHRRIAHKERVYVVGTVHPNTIEGFWSLVKRGIGGVYHSVSAKHLQSYLEEYAFRYNHRKDPGGMFAAFLLRIEKVNPATS